MVVGLLVATACRQTTQGPAAQDLDLPTALTRAETLGHLVAGVVEDVRVERTTSVSEGPEALCEALAEILGPAATETVAGSRVVDGALTYVPGQCNGLEDAAAVGGRSALNLPSLTPVFFYEYSLVDTSTGLFYQTCRGVNSGCDTEQLEFFGPLVPPVEARLIGDFDLDGRRALEDAIRDVVEGT